MFNNRDFLIGIHYYLSQYHGLIRKTLLVHYRRWGITVIVLLLPILYNLLPNLMSSSRKENGIFKMNLNSLNPQTILYHSDPTVERYFHACVNDAKLEQGSENISEMNQNIWRMFFNN